MTESEIKFNNWAIELDSRLLDFQVKPVSVTSDDYWAHRNCVRYDYEIFRLQKFNNPCRSCGIPLHLTNNFEAYDIGVVCGLCYSMYTVLNSSRYFYELHRAWKAQQVNLKKDHGGLAA